MDFTPEERQEYIGGSDISAIMGLNPWKTPQDIFIEKLEDDPKGLKETDYLYWGKALEESIADRWLSERSREGYNIERQEALSTAHPTKTYIRGHPDAIFRGWKDGQPIRCFLEIKTTDSRNASNWTHLAPPYYYVQLAWYAMINARNYENRGETLPDTEYWFAVLIGGNNYKDCQVDINSNDMDLVESKGDEFWKEHIEKEVMPEYDEPDERINSFLFPHVEQHKILECDEFMKKKVDEYRTLKSAMKNMYAQEKHLKELIKNKMGEAQYMVYGNEKIASQTEYDRTSINWEEVAKNYESDSDFNKFVLSQTKKTTIKSLR